MALLLAPRLASLAEQARPLRRRPVPGTTQV
jgi:hypothetical protein